MKNFNDHTKAVFAAMNTNYDEMNNLMQDVALGREIYDAESDRQITKSEANAKILEFSRKILGISDPHDAKEVRRAMRDNGRQWFDIIEDTVDISIKTGLQENDWFDELVESRQIGYHDRVDFWTEEDAILMVAKAGTSHHDHTPQRLHAGEKITIPTELYVVKVTADINRFVAGQEDWTKLVDAITKAYVKEIQTQVYTQVSQAVTLLPSNFKGTGTLVKATFDNIISNVQAANEGAEVVILAENSGISAINGISNVQWLADSQKENFANTGSIGIYEGTKVLSMPVRFADKTLTTKAFAGQILVLPVIGEEGKFIKFIDEGDTMISEQLDRDGKYISDLQTYEVQRRMGVGVVLGRKFGSWVL